MFIGHFGLAFASKRISRRPSLAIMFIACQFLDLLWPVLVLAGVERFVIEPGNTTMTPLNFTYYPYSHSLLMSITWAVLFSVIYYGFTKNGRGALLLGGLVISHWILDFLTHRPDLPLSPFSEVKVGLGLWNAQTIEIVLETGIFLTGVFLYLKSTVVQRQVAFWALVIIFLIIHFLNIFGPPPPSVNAVAWSANLMWLFVIWAWWIEKKKTVHSDASMPSQKVSS